MKRRTIRLDYNAPVTLSFFFFVAGGAAAGAFYRWVDDGASFQCLPRVDG